jgi:hypothetical protein
MKKQITLLMFALVTAAAVNAQETHFGVKAGLNVSNVSGMKNSNFFAGPNTFSTGTNIRIGPHFGAYASISFSDKFAFQPEVLFSVKGYVREYSFELPGQQRAEGNYKLALSYLDIPLQARINVTEGFHILAGPYIGILAGASSVTKTTTNNTTKESKQSSIDGLNPLDVGIVAGAGIKMETGFNLGLKVEKGFSDIDKGADNNTNANLALQFFVGWEF